jgi:hypothetical protein
LLLQGEEVVAAAKQFAVDKDLRHRFPTGPFAHFPSFGKILGNVVFDEIHIFQPQQFLGAPAVGAVMFGIDFNCFHRILLSINLTLSRPSAIARGILTIIVLMLLAGCAPPTGTTDELEPAARDFLHRLRWKDYQGAAGYLLPEHRREFLSSFAEQENLYITDVQLEQVENSAPGQALTSGVLEYYRLPSLSVRKFRIQLEWTYVGGGRLRAGSWLISTSLPIIP